MEKQDVFKFVEAPGQDNKGNLPRLGLALTINDELIAEEDATVQVSIRVDPNELTHAKNPKPSITYELTVKTDNFTDRILKYPIKVLPSDLRCINFKDDAIHDNMPFLSYILLSDKGSMFVFDIIVNVYGWDRPFTFIDYIDILGAIGKTHYANCFIETTDVGGINQEVDGEGYAAISIFFPYMESDETAISAVEKLQEVCNTIYHETTLALYEEKNSVEIVLDLPPNIRVSCEQYLLYFVQFLKDLGVDAEAELTHDAGQVLFSVTPVNKDEALDKIRAALEVYLRLPSGKLAVAGNDPVEIQRLSANILHLQSQLMLAHATIQHKDAAIQFQQATIQHQQLLLAENVITQSVVDITPKKAEDKEEFLGGAFALTKYQGKGFEVSLAEIFRKLKRWFQKD